MSAQEYKDKGNDFFKGGRYAKAIEEYTKSLELEPANTAVLCNRAFAHIKVESFGLALEDASKAIELDPTFIKAFYRRASANLALGKHELALKDLKRVVTIVPGDKDARTKFELCDKQVKSNRFLEAIRSPDDPLLADTLKAEDIVVPESYAGPRADTITPEFVREMMLYFKEQKLVHRRYAYAIVLAGYKVLQQCANVVDVAVPKGKHITVCGDVHGQYYDLVNIFELNGYPSEENPYLFNGDFVDRGSFSAECILTLLAWKVCYPNHLHLTRGNHEGRNLNKVYGFEGEVRAKYDEKLFGLFQEVFNLLPLCCVINTKVFVVHGGLFSKDGVTLDDIRKIDRNRDIPDEGLMCEMLWSDPAPMRGRTPNKRGVGVAFGPDVTENFLRTNNLELIIRSHEVKDEGFEKMHNDRLITVFSAPNYCDQIGNKGAFIKLHGDNITKPNITSFSEVPHPPTKPMQYSMMPGML
eukprot:TRINITY_DN55537_c0_g1_i1.p1 TRINITY_DN55537_c0_g1~~TRINITY_DN55537_c0_g1_i1.p1  ORF type:complete len:470 (-),score=79.18 TRINITY_DN55537_c0_g1_i1:64-1473(-)